jgi:hypothetical protein
MVKTLELSVTRRNSYSKSGFLEGLEDMTVFFNETSKSIDEYIQEDLIRQFEVPDEALFDGYTVGIFFAEMSNINAYELKFRDIKISTDGILTEISEKLDIEVKEINPDHINDWLSARVGQWQYYDTSNFGENSVVFVRNSYSLMNYIELLHDGNQSDFARKIGVSRSYVSKAIKENYVYFNGKVYREAPRFSEFGLEVPKDSSQVN